MKAYSVKKVKPILASVLLTILFLILYNIGALPGYIIDEYFIPGDSHRCSSYAAILTAVIAFLIYNGRQKKKYGFTGCITSDNSYYAIGVLAVFAVITAVFGIIPILLKGASIGFSYENVLSSAYAGICEEITFRAVPLSTAMAAYKRGDEKKMMAPVIVTSLLFGCVHLMNLKAGATVPNTIVQVIFCIPTGMLMSALFLRTGSVIPPILAHTFNDIIAFMDTSMVEGNGSGVMSGAIQPVDYIVAVITEGIFLFMAIKILNNRTGILDIWDHKWNSVGKNLNTD